jgi:hypothetical protein
LDEDEEEEVTDFLEGEEEGEEVVGDGLQDVSLLAGERGGTCE